MKILTTALVSAALAASAPIAFADGHKSAHAHSKPDIVEIASSKSDFSTLVAALKAADLVAALQADGPYTVFAPTNAAFDALPEGTVASLLEPENKDALTSVLTYHVIPSKVMAGDIPMGKTKVKTLQGTTRFRRPFVFLRCCIYLHDVCLISKPSLPWYRRSDNMGCI